MMTAIGCLLFVLNVIAACAQFERRQIGGAALNTLCAVIVLTSTITGAR